MGSFPYVLCRGTPGDVDDVRGLIGEAAGWLRASKNTDQCADPWPDRKRWSERILNDLIKAKIWIARDGAVAVGTVTIDTGEPLDLDEWPVWPDDERHCAADVAERDRHTARNYPSQALFEREKDWSWSGRRDFSRKTN